MSERCPTCGSDDPKVCNGTGKQNRPHKHGKWECCCADPWHSAPESGKEIREEGE